MSLTSLLVPTYKQMLQSLSAWIDKAAKAERSLGRDPEALLSLCLANDMFPLSSQIRFACLQSQEAAFRLRCLPAPSELDDLAREGREAGEQPGTLAGAQTKIRDALALLDGLEPDALDDGKSQPIAIELPDGLAFELDGEQYARDWALPQFYFHVMTAYGILRHHGVDLGKADYVPHMFQYVRSGTTTSE